MAFLSTDGMDMKSQSNAPVRNLIGWALGLVVGGASIVLGAICLLGTGSETNAVGIDVVSGWAMVFLLCCAAVLPWIRQFSWLSVAMTTPIVLLGYGLNFEVFGEVDSIAAWGLSALLLIIPIATLGGGIKHAKTLSCAIALLVTSLWLTGLASLWSGVPLILTGEGVPYAAMPMLAYALLGVSLLLVLGPWEWSRQKLRRTFVRGSSNEEWSGQWLWHLASWAMMIFVGIGAVAYLQIQKVRVDGDLYNLLTNVANLKLEQIKSWRHERKADAYVLSQTPSLQDYFALRQGKERLFKLFHEYCAHYDYREVALLGPDMQPLVADFDFRHNILTEFSIQDLQHFREPEFEDVILEKNGELCLGLLSPIRQMDGSLSGALLLHMDPRKELFPMLNSWPTPSDTAETYLIKKKGDRAVFLSDLKKMANAPLRFSLSLNDKNLLCVKALSEGQLLGLTEGEDYRGRMVLAISRKVPGSDWVLMTKIDQTEAYENVRVEIWRAAGTLFLALTVGNLLLGNLWKTRQRMFDARQQNLERERLAAEARLSLVLRYANDVILVVDQQKRIIDANERVSSFYGRTVGEMKKMTVSDLRPDETKSDIDTQMERALSPGGVVFETLHRHKDGHVFPVEISARPVEIDGRPLVLAIIRNITQRRAQQDEIQRLSRIYHVVSEINQAIVREKSPRGLFAEICRILVDIGLFKAAAVSLEDPTHRRLVPTASAGASLAMIRSVEIAGQDGQPLTFLEPEAQAFLTGETVICNDIHDTDSSPVWRSLGTRDGLGAAIALPLKKQGRVVGVFVVMAMKVNRFTPQKTALLQEALQDVSHALEGMDRDQQRLLVEENLRVREEIFSSIVGQAGDGIALVDMETLLLIEFNHMAHEMLGYTREEFCTVKISDLEALQNETEIRRNFTHFIQHGGAIFESQLRHKKGHTIEVRINARHISLRGKNYVAAIWSDVTESNRMDRERRENERRLADLMRNLPGMVYRCRNDEFWTMEFVSEGATALTGYKPEELMWNRKIAFSDLIHPDDLELVSDKVNLAVRQLKSFQLRYRITTAAGAERWVWEQGQAIRNDKGEFLFLEGFIMDVTDRHLAQQALVESEAKHRVLFEQLYLGVLYMDDAGRYTEANPAACAMLNLDLAQLQYPELRPNGWGLVGENGELFSAESLPMVTTLCTGKPSGDVLVGVVNHEDASTRWLLIHAVPEFIAGDERPHRVFAILTDVSERRRAELEMRKLSLALEQSPVSVLITNLSGEIEYVNSFFTQVSGYRLEEVRGKNPRILKSGKTSSELYRDLWGTITRGQNWRGEIINRRKDGSLYVEQTYISPLKDSSGKITHYVAIREDITSRKRAENELRRNRDQLARAEQMARLGNWELEIKTGVVSWSDEVYRIYETDMSNFVPSYEAFYDLLPPSDKAKVRSVFEKAVKEHLHFSVEHRLIFSGNRIKYVELNAETIYDSQGEPVRSIGTVQDVTERKLIELELHELLKELRAFHAVSLAIDDRNLSVESLIQFIAEHLPEAVTDQNYAQAEVVIDRHKFVAGVPGPRVSEVSAQVLINGRRAGHVLIGYVESPADELIGVMSSHEKTFVETVARTVSLGLGERESLEMMQRSEERFRSIFDHAEVGMFECTPRGVIRRANRHMGRLLGCESGSLLDKSWLSLIEESWRYRFSETPPVEPHEVLVMRGSGQKFWSMVSSRMEMDSSGNILGYICLLQDISNQVMARETLLRFNAELETKVNQRTAELDARNREVQALLEAVPDMVMRLRTDGVILYSKKSRESTALAALTIRNHDHDTLHVPDDLHQAGLTLGRRALKEQNTLSTEAIIGSPAGRIYLELRASPAGQSEFVVFVRDITARKRLEEETAAMLEREREVSEMKTRFISVTSHEFRTPLSAAVGSVDLLTNHIDRLTPEKRGDLLGRIDASLQKMTGMLDDILTLSRIESNRVEVHRENIDLRHFVSNLIEDIRLGDGSRHQFDLLCEQVPVPFVTDTKLLHHILSNLLSNAVRYSEAQTTVRVEIHPEPKSVRLIVSDQGIGIPAGDRLRIFEPFERGSNVGNIKGTGLGLNIVKRMTEVLGGSITLQSSRGGGTRFLLQFPNRTFSNDS